MKRIVNEEKAKYQLIVDGLMLLISNMKRNIGFFFVNHEYNENIGTIYKGSTKESRDFLRFKERFKKKIVVASWCAGNLCREAI